MLSGAQLNAAIQTLVSRPLKDIFYRAMLLKFARDPLGRTRPIRPNRFNVENGARVLYLADSIETALHEVQAFGFPPHAVAIVPVKVDLNSVVDLRDPQNWTALQLTVQNLTLNFRALPPGAAPAPTQELGECAAASARVDGMLYESLARPGATNLVVFETNLTLLNSFVIVDDLTNGLHDRLP